MRPPKDSTDELRRLRKLWDEHTHTLAPVTGPDPRQQEVALYASWIGSIVEAALRRGSLDRNRASMLVQRRMEGNERLFRAAGELGEPVRSYVARLIALEDLLAELPVK
ncbi:MAG TPA: hypothetical protein VJR46_09580 [Candidatus Dormibacteraeota bacterium]|nr:hypothetical protein [Candidatus Dormibacteraeota bacterium]